MQVAFNSESLGTVSLRATLHHGEIGAVIQVSNREAHSALVAELPALERSLGDRGVRWALDISHGTTNGGSEQQRAPEYHGRRADSLWQSPNPETPATTSTYISDLQDKRLSVHA